jgi:Family of unknown function (DUF6328)
VRAAHAECHCQTCASSEHDEWNAGARGETPLQRVDRAYGEILQEVRVAQRGVQVLFAFLLTLAFTSRFASVTQFQRDTYVLTLMLCAAAAELLIAPASFHRVVYRSRLKHHLDRIASRLALSGLVLLLLALISALLLILDVVIGLVRRCCWRLARWAGSSPDGSSCRCGAASAIRLSPGTCRMNRTTACSRRDRLAAPGLAAGARRWQSSGIP